MQGMHAAGLRASDGSTESGNGFLAVDCPVGEPGNILLSGVTIPAGFTQEVKGFRKPLTLAVAALSLALTTRFAAPGAVAACALVNFSAM
jgi:hypothetical protein